MVLLVMARRWRVLSEVSYRWKRKKSSVSPSLPAHHYNSFPLRSLSNLHRWIGDQGRVKDIWQPTVFTPTPSAYGADTIQCLSSVSEPHSRIDTDHVHLLSSGSPLSIDLSLDYSVLLLSSSSRHLLLTCVGQTYECWWYKCLQCLRRAQRL